MSTKKKVQEAQKYLKEGNIDGWLLYDFRRSNDLAHQFLEISPRAKITRRFFYWIPAKGDPIKLVHSIESYLLDGWPGEKREYFSWQSLQAQLELLLKEHKTVAMEYSPMCAIPYNSRVDAGTIEMIYQTNTAVVSSAAFLPHFTAVLDDYQMATHLQACEFLDHVVKETWQWLADSLKSNHAIYEHDVTNNFITMFESEGYITEGELTCAVNVNSSDPHYSPSKAKPVLINKGDFILIDLWCKKKEDKAIWGDITRVAVASSEATERQNEIFQHVRNAQRAATDLIRMRFAENRPVQGWEVDQAARDVIDAAGYGEFFLHRTGHSIEVALHGSGVHMDNLEMHDERPLIPRTCFSIEPGIYLPNEFGVRLEHDVLIDKDANVQVNGGIQEEITCLFS